MISVRSERREDFQNAARPTAREAGTATTSQPQKTAMKPRASVDPATSSMSTSALQAATDSAVTPRSPSEKTQPLMLRDELR